MRGRFWFVVVAVLVLLAAPMGDAGAKGSADVQKSFNAFCRTWMQKLETREVSNRRKAVLGGKQLDIEYTGYSDEPIRCETKPSGVKSNPYIGKLVYHELRYRKNGAARPAVVEAVEVMEIFRFDGRRWVY